MPRGNAELSPGVWDAFKRTICQIKGKRSQMRTPAGLTWSNEGGSDETCVLQNKAAAGGSFNLNREKILGV